MDNQQQAIPTLSMGDVLKGISDFFGYLRSKALQALVLMAVGGIITSAYYLIQKPKYEGTVSFILEEKSSGMGGGLSGLASQFGFDVGSLTGSAGLFAGDNILDILKSRTIVEKVLLTKVDSAANAPTLADVYLNFTGLHKRWASIASVGEVNFTTANNGQPNTRLQDSALLVIFQKLVKKHLTVERLNKKGSIIQVVTTTPNEVFSKLFTERLVVETMKMYVELKTSVANKNISRLQFRSDSLLTLLNARSFKSADLQFLDANIAYRSAAVPVEVSQREKSVTYALYSEVMKNLEASRIALAGQTPVINILDNAKYPLENQQLSLGLLLLIGVMGGLAISLVLAFINFKPSN